MAELAAILKKRRSITDAEPPPAAPAAAEAVPESKSKRLPPAPRRRSSSKAPAGVGSDSKAEDAAGHAAPSPWPKSARVAQSSVGERPDSIRDAGVSPELVRDGGAVDAKTPASMRSARGGSSVSPSSPSSDTSERRKSPSTSSLSNVGDYIKDRRVSNSFIEELVDQGEELKRRSSLEVNVNAPPSAARSAAAASSQGSTTASGVSSALLGEMGLPGSEDDTDVAAVLAANSDSSEDGDTLLFGAPLSSGKRMKAKWGLYGGGGDDDDDDDLLLGAGSGDGGDTDRHALMENLGAGSEMHLRARNRSLVSRVRMLEKELASAKLEITRLKQTAAQAAVIPAAVAPGFDPSSSDGYNDVVSNTFDATPRRAGRHARHTSMPDPFGIDDDVVEKPIDVSTGRSSSLSSRSSSFGQQSNICSDDNQKSGRDMLLSDSPVRAGTGAAGRDGIDDSGKGSDDSSGDGNVNVKLARAGSTNLFEEVDRDAEEERRLLEEAGGSHDGNADSEDDGSGGKNRMRVEDQGGDHGSTIVEAPSDTYHSSEAKRSRGYRRFLDNFRKRQAADLLTDIKRFVTSVLMPQKNVYGDGGGGRQNDALEDRAAQWFAYMDTRFRNHSIWEDAGEEELEMARGECSAEFCLFGAVL